MMSLLGDGYQDISTEGETQEAAAAAVALTREITGSWATRPLAHIMLANKAKTRSKFNESKKTVIRPI